MIQAVDRDSTPKDHHMTSAKHVPVITFVNTYNLSFFSLEVNTTKTAACHVVKKSQSLQSILLNKHLPASLYQQSCVYVEHLLLYKQLRIKTNAPILTGDLPWIKRYGQSCCYTKLITSF